MMTTHQDPDSMVLGWGPGTFTDHRADHTIDVDVCLAVHDLRLVNVIPTTPTVACIEIHGDGATLTMELTEADIRELQAVLANHLHNPISPRS